MVLAKYYRVLNLRYTLQRDVRNVSSSKQYSCLWAIGGVCAKQAGDGGVMTGVYTAETGERWTLHPEESFDNNPRPPSLTQRLQSPVVVS